MQFPEMFTLDYFALHPQFKKAIDLVKTDEQKEIVCLMYRVFMDMWTHYSQKPFDMIVYKDLEYIKKIT